MQTSIHDLDLFHLPWETPEFAADPYPFLEAARARHPWLARSNAGFVVFELRAIRELLVRDDQMRTSFDGIADIMNARGTPWGRFVQEQMIALPDDEHKVLRTALATKFTPRYASQLRGIMGEVMDHLLDEWAGKSSFDFEEFASYYPIAVLNRMVGAPAESLEPIRSSLEAMGLSMSLDAALVPQLDAAMATLDAFAADLLAKRHAVAGAEREPDLLDLIIKAGDESGIAQRRLLDLIIFLYVAGYDTSKNVLTYMMHLMLRSPEIYAQCADDLDYCRQAVEETFRLFNPSSTFRATREDIVYRDVLIPRETMLFFTLSVAGRDPAEFVDPHAFVPERTVPRESRHVAFGLGKHMCLGQHIARVQLQEGIHRIAKRWHSPTSAGEPGWRPFPGVWGIKGLPITVSP
jgi:cytochrome P450